MSATNFNYQVALKEGLKNLQQGRLRQAEQHFKYLVEKFPGAEGGYRGLAKVHFEEEDRANALRVLREGAAALTKSGERGGAIGLLREAVTLDPKDLGTHRRLAAALALAGDTDAAVKEHARFIRELRDAGDVERAKSEAAYALGQLKGVDGAAALGALATERATPTPPPAPASPSGAKSSPTAESKPDSTDARAEATATHAPAADPWSAARSAPKSESEAAPSEAIANDPWAAPRPKTESRVQAPARPAAEIADDPWAKVAVPSEAPSWVAGEVTAAPPAPERAPTYEAEAPAFVESVAEVTFAPADVVEVETAEPVTTADSDGHGKLDPAGVEAAAAQYLATRDPRAGKLALEAARHYIEEGHTDAASDLLLQLIAAGVADHDAQRLLVDIARTLGKQEVARAKCQLLAQALLLDGRNDLAAEVEALAKDG